MACEKLTDLLKGDAACFSNNGAASEKGKRFGFDNPMQKPICRVRVDNCLISDVGIKKCDYLFEVNANNYYLVELKGSDLATAIDQIVNTYEIVNAKIKAHVDNYRGIIISSGVPGSANLKFRNMVEKVRRDKRLIISKYTDNRNEKI